MVKVKNIAVYREAQVACAMNSYQVSVDGYTVGKIGSGKTLTAQSRQEVTTVEIVCTTVMINAKLTLKLAAGPETRVSFKVEYPGKIYATVAGAEILQQLY
jgi:hypothetical protein